MIRRLLILSLLSSVLTWYSLHRAKAATGQELMQLGDSAFELMNSDQREGRMLVFNGWHMRIVTGKTPQSLSLMLDAFESECRHGESAQLPAPPLSEPQLSPFLRWQEEGGGVAVCVAPQDPLRSVSSWSERLHTFASTRDVNDVGQIRYLRVMKSHDATTFVSMVSEGPLPLDSLLPQLGDVPGTDMQGVPRPKSSVRALSAHEKDKAAWLAAYKVSASPQSAREQYLSQLKASGLHVIPGTTSEEGFVVEGPGIAPAYVSVTGNHSEAFVAMIR